MFQKTKASFQDYYLGLDIGTSSVGWAVTDLNYNILKFNQKAMWGIRLFDEGNTAETRRTARSARRRLSRRNQRLQWLREIFAEEINKKDPGFFQRLADSKYHIEDKATYQKNSLFNDPDFTDKEYHKRFPTINHLKVELMTSDEVFDVRLVYLAIANTLKHRGHFIFEDQSLDNVNSFELAYQEFINGVNDTFGYGETDDALSDGERFEAEKPAELRTLLLDKKKRKNEKKKEILSIFNLAKTHPDYAFLKAILESVVGSKISTKNLIEEESDEKVEFAFGDGGFDEGFDNIERIIGSDKMEILLRAKILHDWAVLEDILDGKESISLAKVEKYLEHKEDLEKLKKLVKRDFDNKTYDEIFKYDYMEANYHAYIFGKGRNSSKKDDYTVKYEKASQENFCKYLMKKLDKQKSHPEYVELFNKMENFSFLPKQREKSNAVVPYQVHLYELEKILNKAEKYLPFLLEKDQDDLTNREKIIAMMTFRIPYYVGPLNDFHKDGGDKKSGGNAWIVRKLKGTIYPWNFEKMVDIDRSAEAFIRRMTNKCTYLIDEDVLPKESLLYSEFMMLNELNNVRIDGNKLDPEQKKKIIRDLFEKNQKVTQKKLKTYLWKEGCKNSPDAEITGIDGDFKASLSALIQFKRILNKELFTDAEKLMIEDIIESVVLFGEDKKILEKRVRERYPQLTNEQIKGIVLLKFSGWGRFSKTLLTEIDDVDPQTGERYSLIQALRNTSENLMELLSASRGFRAAVEDFNKDKIGVVEKLDYDMVEKLYVSPKVKRSIWQSLQIVEEIRKITGKAPTKIFVEVERDVDAKKERTISRKEQLKALYATIQKEDREYWTNQLEKHSDAELRQEKLYLYYTQMGKCMYSGNKIDLHSLLTNSGLYDVDHIHPRSKVKDNSLDNKVLVEAHLNKVKGDEYPLPKDFQKNRALWKQLLEKDFISKKKYERLTRTTGFEANELADFINRQLVEARQSSKAVIQILGQLFPATEIVYSKAGNVFEFRQENGLVKVRELNDYHHAKDAYLNIVVGNVFNTQFTKSPINFVKSGQTYSLNHKAIFNREIKRGEITAWVPGEDGTIATVRRMMAKNNIRYTRLSYEVKGELFDGNPLRKGKGQQPLKGDPRMQNIDKYGGYNKVTGAYFALVEHTSKKKRVRSIEYIPLTIANEIKVDPSRMDRYFKEKGFVDFKVLISKIKSETLFEINGAPMHITGRTGDALLFKHAIQLVVSQEDAEYLKRITKFVDRLKKTKGELLVDEKDGITAEANKRLYDLFAEKIDSTAYKSVLNSQVGMLREAENEFMALSLEKQIEALRQILFFFQCNRVLSDLSSLGGGKIVGTIKYSKRLSNWKSGKIIHQSVTGLFEQEIDLMKI